MAAKVSELTDDELVKLYVQLRDRRAEAKKAWENQDEDMKAKQGKIEGLLLARFNERGIESARTVAGTAFKAKSEFASVADKDAFFNFIKENDAFEFLESRCNKTAIRQYIETNNDLPPGINWREEIHIQVRRA